MIFILVIGILNYFYNKKEVASTSLISKEVIDNKEASKNLSTEAAQTLTEERVDLMINGLIKAQLKHPYRTNENLVITDEDSTGIGMDKDHWENTGIETAKISSAEEEKLYLMTVESIKAQLEYYSTEKDEGLEKVKDLYLSEAFEQYKEDIKYEDDSNDIKGENQSYKKIKTIEFSKPRAYKDLPDRIGIIVFTYFIDYYTNRIYSLFVFKNINGEWKIEKREGLDIRSDILENMLIQEIRDKK